MESVDSEPDILALAFIAGLIAIFSIVVVKIVVSRVGVVKAPIRIHPYEIAYLCEGRLLSIQAVICYLMAKGIVRIESVDGRDVIVRDESSIDKLSELHQSSQSSNFYDQSSKVVEKLEQNLLQSLDGQSRTEIESESNLNSFRTLFEEIEKNLIDQGLLFSKIRELANKLALFFASVLPVALILITRIVELYSANRSVFLESIITLVALGLASTAANLSDSKSKKGEKFLSSGKRELLILVKSFKNNTLSISPEDFVRAFALTGRHFFFIVEDQSEFKSFFFPEVKSLSEHLGDED